MKPVLTAVLLFLLIGQTPALPAGPRAAKSWLDGAPVNWNKASATVPRAPSASETNAAVIKRCKLTPPHTTAAERAVEAAGWIPYWNLDQQLVRDDIEIVGGMRNADGSCGPTTYHLFVFVGGKFAGTLSPEPMTSRTDGSSGAVRIQPKEITVEFSRYASADPACCPSAHATAHYRIDRSATGALVVPTEIRPRP